MDNHDNKQRVERDYFACGCLTAFILAGLAWVFLLLALSGCSPKVIENVRTEYVYQDRIERDTTIVHDSVHVREFIKGDTVWVTEYRDRNVYRYKYIRDTLAVHDSVAVETIKEVEVEKPLSAGQKAKIGAFWWLLISSLLLLLWNFRHGIIATIKKFL